MSTLTPLTLLPYEPMWIPLFHKAKNSLLHEFGKTNIYIEHIGGTAIPGSISKPEIDILVGVNKLPYMPLHIDSLEKIEYMYFPKIEKFDPIRDYPLFHIHMVEQKSQFWYAHIAFREYLKNHPEYITKYNNLKKDLIVKFNHNREKYNKGKDAFICGVIKKLSVEGNNRI